MPIHDWTRVEAGIFYDFHHDWITTLKRSLNDGRLPAGFYALAEQIASDRPLAQEKAASACWMLPRAYVSRPARPWMPMLANAIA